MKNSIFWFVSLGFLLIIANVIGLTVPLRVAIFANACVFIIDIIKTIRRWYNDRKA